MHLGPFGSEQHCNVFQYYISKSEEDVLENGRNLRTLSSQTTPGTSTGNEKIQTRQWKLNKDKKGSEMLVNLLT